jgi:hypothetical protein
MRIKVENLKCILMKFIFKFMIISLGTIYIFVLLSRSFECTGERAK